MAPPLGPAAAMAMAVFVGMFVHYLGPRPTRLRDRVRPYTRPAASALGVRGSFSESNRSWQDWLARAGRVLEGSSDAVLSRKLRQARVLSDVPTKSRTAVYRSRVVASSVIVGGLALALAVLLRRSAPVALGFTALGCAAGASFWRGRLDRAIETRRALMRIELYTVNQLLAMHIRVGSGVVYSVTRLVARGRGEVVAELSEVVRLHRSGVPAAEAFRRIAAATPEPHARRTYHALAAADERGSDVARALLALSEDVRDGRRNAIRRRATRRRALMLVPILGLLAPVLILFVAAPLPWLVLHGFG